MLMRFFREIFETIDQFLIAIQIFRVAWQNEFQIFESRFGELQTFRSLVFTREFQRLAGSVELSFDVDVQRVDVQQRLLVGVPSFRSDSWSLVGSLNLFVRLLSVSKV